MTFNAAAERARGNKMTFPSVPRARARRESRLFARTFHRKVGFLKVFESSAGPRGGIYEAKTRSLRLYLSGRGFTHAAAGYF